MSIGKILSASPFKKYTPIFILLIVISFFPHCKTEEEVEESGLKDSGYSLEMLYSTLWGTRLSCDIGYFIELDKDGNIYIAGMTHSVDFPLKNPVYTRKLGSQQGYITKFSADGQTVIYSSYFGGNDGASVGGLAVDASGNAIIAGGSGSTDFPLKNPLFSEGSGYLSSIKKEGSEFNFSTKIPFGAVVAMDRDSEGNIYIVTNQDYILKISPDGRQLLYSFQIEYSEGYTSIGDMVVDQKGCVIITGSTKAHDFPLKNPIRSNIIGETDIFVTKISTDGSSIIFSTFFGGANLDSAYGVCVDHLGYIYISGLTNSQGFLTLNGYDLEHNGGWDSFVVKIDPEASKVIYSTYLGGSNDDKGWGIAVDQNGLVYVVGSTVSEDFPMIGAYNKEKTSTVNAFITVLDSSGKEIIVSSFFGGSFCNDIILKSEKDFYLVGQAGDSYFPVMNPFPNIDAGGCSTFVTRFKIVKSN